MYLILQWENSDVESEADDEESERRKNRYVLSVQRVQQPNTRIFLCIVLS